MGVVYWITGLSGAGKTTLGRIFYSKLKKKAPETVFLDGDTLREVFGGDLGYSKEDRIKCAMRYSRMCKMLAEQDMNVVICTISMFDIIRQWNRENINDYKEIYIKVPFEILKQRDQKGLYSGTSTEEDTTISGVSFDFEEPQMPDIIIENLGDISPEILADRIWNEL